MSDPMNNIEKDIEENTAHQGAEEASWSLNIDEHDHSGAYEPSTVDVAIVGFAWVVLVVSLVMTFRYIFRPGEKSEDHIKRRILNDGGPR